MDCDCCDFWQAALLFLYRECQSPVLLCTHKSLITSPSEAMLLHYQNLPANAAQSIMLNQGCCKATATANSTANGLTSCKRLLCLWKNSFTNVAEAVQQLLAVRDELEDAGTPLGAGRTAKAWATQHILQRCQKRGEKLVIFCQYLTDLDEIEAGLKQVPAKLD